MAQTENGTIRIYCDFDGTIVKEDVGDAFFETFAGHEMWADNELYRNGEITAQELYRRNTSRISHLDESKIERFCSGFNVEPTFHEFVRWAERKQFPILVLSDGLDVYIATILNTAGLNVPFTANEFRLRDDGTAEMSFPYSHPDCTCSANCKRNHVVLRSGDDDYIVYIGDGISDFCPAEYSDLVFAKGELETYCQERNISFRRFYSFHDIIEVIEGLAGRKRLRKPRRAELLRRSVWLSG